MRTSRIKTPRTPQTRTELRAAIEKMSVSVETFTSLPNWDRFTTVGMANTGPDENSTRNVAKALDEAFSALRVVNTALARGLGWRIPSVTSPAERRFLRKFWGIFCILFVVGICGLFYMISQPIASFEDLNKFSGQIERVSIQRTGGGRQPVEYFINVRVREQPNTIFWTRLHVQELSQTLKPGMMTEIWVNPDFRVGMERGEIRQISVGGTLFLSYGDWVRWKKGDNKVGQWFALFLIIPAFFSGYYAFKPRRRHFKTYNEVEGSKRQVSDASQRLLNGFRALESASEWESLSDIQRDRRALGKETPNQVTKALSDLKDSLRTINKALEKIGSQLNA